METNKHFESALLFLETRPCAERIQSNLVPPNWLCRETDGRKMHKCCCLTVTLALCQAWIKVPFLLRDFIVVLWKTS